jgi:hypothetical protein
MESIDKAILGRCSLNERGDDVLNRTFNSFSIVDDAFSCDAQCQ